MIKGSGRLNSRFFLSEPSAQPQRNAQDADTIKFTPHNTTTRMPDQVQNKDLIFNSLMVHLRQALKRDEWCAFVAVCQSHKETPVRVLRTLLQLYINNSVVIETKQTSTLKETK